MIDWADGVLEVLLPVIMMAFYGRERTQVKVAQQAAATVRFWRRELSTKLVDDERMSLREFLLDFHNVSFLLCLYGYI